MIDTPRNDVSCLSKLHARARRFVDTIHARLLARRLGMEGGHVNFGTDLDALIGEIRNKPQHPQSVRGRQVIHCDTAESARYWSSDPDCFERTMDFLAVAETAHPEAHFSSVTIALRGGHRHTMPMFLSASGEWNPVNLSPYQERGDDAWYQDVLGGLDVAGGIVAKGYGYGGVADAAHTAEQKAGFLPSWDQSKAAPAGATRAGGAPAAPSTAPAAIEARRDTSTRSPSRRRRRRGPF